jgi:membrane associated rhomboid family serine protease
MNDNHFEFTPRVILLPFFSVLLLWVIFWAEVRFNLDLGVHGIYPRTLEGIPGIIFSPFIHGNIEHLYNNSIPLLILLTALCYFYRELALKVVVYGVLLTGLITWIIGRENYHIGASGLVYVLVSFIFFKGIMTKYYRLVALSLVVIMVYGSLAWYVFPHVDEGISWEGHLAGLLTGFIFAIRFKTPEYTKMIKYEWEKPDFNPGDDKFLQRFDENGNFVNLPKPEPEAEIAPDTDASSPSFTYTYHYIPKDKPTGQP